MKKFKITALALSMLALAQPALALSLYGDTSVGAGVNTTGTSVNVDASLATRIEIGKNRANQEIDRRITALTSLETRVNAMSRVSTSMKATISSGIQGQITLLTNLKTKIASDSDIATLKTDIQSITNSYRIFVLIIPQGHIAATVDAINTTDDLMTTFQSKLQTRLDAAQTAGNDTTAEATLLADMNAKIAQSKVLAQAAIDLTANLKPDNGDQTVLQSNNLALKAGREKLKVARADLQAARSDAQKILVALKGMKVDANASASSATSIH